MLSAMPIFWWYLLRNYLKVLGLAVVSFIAILLVIRLEEIAYFATIGAPLAHIALFTLYQVPYILPIAIPISCLISALILFQRLSHGGELTAFRAGGISLRKLMSPILIASALLALGTFYVSSEMATASHLATRKMVYDLTSVNPLLLLQSAKIARLQNAFIQMDPIRNGEAAGDLIIALQSLSAKRLSLCIAKKVEMVEGELIARQVSLISSSPSDRKRDNIILEHQEWMSSSAPQFAALLRKTGWKISNDHLKFSLLRARMADAKGQMVQEPKMEKVFKKCQSEVARRLSVGIAAFTFTFMGVASGMEISRQRSKRGIWTVLCLGALGLISFCIGKDLDHLPLLSSTLFLAPHALIMIASLATLRRVNRGIE